MVLFVFLELENRNNFLVFEIFSLGIMGLVYVIEFFILRDRREMRIREGGSGSGG